MVLTQNSLYGCAVDVGLYTDSNNKVLEFYVNKAYARTIYRGESGCFVAMDKKEVVVEVSAATFGCSPLTCLPD